MMWCLRDLWRLLFGGDDDDDEPFHGYRSRGDYHPRIGGSNAGSRSRYREDYHSRTSDRPPSPAAPPVLRGDGDEFKRILGLEIILPGSPPRVSDAPIPSSKRRFLAPESSTISTFSNVQIQPEKPLLVSSPSIRDSGAHAQPSGASPSSSFSSSLFSSLSRVSPAPAPASPSSSNSIVSEVRVRDFRALSPPLRFSPSPNPSSGSSSTSNSSISEAPVSVLKIKAPILQLDSATRFSEKPSSSSPSLPSSPMLPPALIPCVKIWREKKPNSIEQNRISPQKPSTASPSSIRVRIPPPTSSSESCPSSPHQSPPCNRRSLPICEIPKYLEEMIKRDIVPPVLFSPLSPATYADYFATLLYAEDFYIEKWSKYLLEGVLLELRSRKTLSSQSNSSIVKKNNKLVNRDFVAFHVDAVPEKRPFLLSRDFVFLKPLDEMAGPFKGILFRVEKNVVLVEFGEDFHLQHSPSKRYDVSFSFNRVCLKRAHQAISASSDPSFHSILFPIEVPSLLHGNIAQSSHQLPITRIMNHKGPFPYLIEGPLSVTQTLAPTDDEEGRCLSVTGRIIQEAILNIYSRNPICKILVCSPRNSTSDVLLRSLSYKMPKWMLFRANAAFRNYTEVPDDIIHASLYEEEEECFAFPPPLELRNFIVITSTFMSSFRLRAAGIDNEHFTHIFLVDSSLATEPEAIVPLANLAGKKTVVFVSGCLSKVPGWVRSDIARKHGLKVSYFHRLCKREPYRSRADMFISHIE
ncbi:putative RNA helicase SDE3 [Apostasia shenzhenica]|uniref:Putative RNA helicase SDE3 n=1 Tax=Apostasia shenzhenica TaxID=1088818 RepID=A0A2I0A9A8_9ASPA|nr:putative RNA helicase SDE3 [Apostasia shenzhenica]